MKWHHALWRKLTDTEALRESSGRYETEFFEFTYRIMYLTGFSQSDHSVGYKLYSYCIRLLIAMFIGGECWYLCTMSSSLDEVVANMAFIVMNLNAIYWYQIRVKNNHIYKKLAMSMESPYFDVSTTRRKDIVQLWLKRSGRYQQLLLGLGSCSMAALYITPIFDDVDYNLVINLRVPYDYEKPLRYAFTYTVVVIAFLCTAYFVYLNDQIRQSHLMHLLCQFQILANCFENIIEDCSIGFVGYDDQALFSNKSFQRKYTDQLRKCFRQHLFLLDHTQQFRRIMSNPMLFQLGSSGMLICFTAYQVTAAVTGNIKTFMMSLLFLGYNLFVLFVFCRWCEEIKRKSEAISKAVCMSGWERGLVAAMPRVRLRLLIIAARASRPLVLTAGGLYELSLSSYASLLKVSYSALTLLLQVRRRHE